MPLYPSKVLQVRERAPTPYSSIIFCLGLIFESLKELGVCHVVSKNIYWFSNATYFCVEGIQAQKLSKGTYIHIHIIKTNIYGNSHFNKQTHNSSQNFGVSKTNNDILEHKHVLSYVTKKFKPFSHYDYIICL